MLPADMPELGVVNVAAPCSSSWSRMKGDARVRFCDQCKLRVYNLSDLTADEARALFQQHEGQRMCVKFYQRKDGTVLTRQCPKGLAAELRRKNGFLAFVGAVFAAMLALFAYSTARARTTHVLGGIQVDSRR